MLLRSLAAFLALGLVYFANGFIDVMDVDAAQYAELAREMTESGSYLQVYLRGEDYLDKPPLLFWLSALSFKLFGVGNFAYKLPAILVLILGLFSVYRFTLHWYDRNRALVATLILGSSMAYFLMTNDVRTDGLLTGFVIFSVWQLSLFLDGYKIKHLLLGALGAACAMMTKGPLGLAIIAFAIGGHVLLRRDWKDIFKPQWVLFLAVVAVLLVPMCYGLYTQFDLHPEKEVYGLQGPSGIEFFFWTQSFGRITGDIYWDNNTGPFYFFQTMLWDFQPWVLFVFPALVWRVLVIVRNGFKIDKGGEALTISGFVLAFMALSLSNYKLPHYVFPLFPFAAIITADFVYFLAGNRERLFRALSTVQFGLMHVFFIACVISFVLFFTPESIITPVVVAIGFGAFWYLWIKIKNRVEKVVFTSVTAITTLGLVLAIYFYPTLLEFQAGTTVGRELKEDGRIGNLYYFTAIDKTPPYSLDFYSQRITPVAEPGDLAGLPEGSLLYVENHELDALRGSIGADDIEIDSVYDYYHVTLLNLKFLMKDTREEKLSKVYLMEKQ